MGNKTIAGLTAFQLPPPNPPRNNKNWLYLGEYTGKWKPLENTNQISWIHSQLWSHPLPISLQQASVISIFQPIARNCHSAFQTKILTLNVCIPTALNFHCILNTVKKVRSIRILKCIMCLSWTSVLSFFSETC